MEIVALIIGTVLGTLALSSDRIMFLIRSILSAISGYWVFTLIYPDTYIVDFKNYDLHLISYWIHSGIGLLSILCWIISYAFFYGIMRIILQIIFNKKISQSVTKRYSTLTPKEIIAVKGEIVSFAKKIVKVLLKYNITSYEANSPKVTKESIEKTIFNFIELISHVVFCWFVLEIYLSFPIYIGAILIIAILFGLCIVVSALQGLSFVIDIVNSENIVPIEYRKK